MANKLVRGSLIILIGNIIFRIGGYIYRFLMAILLGPTAYGILGITLPEKVDYEVIETTDAVKGNTTNNAMKDATIETGYVVKVPMFIGVGEKILITTKDGKYSSRA